MMGETYLNRNAFSFNEGGRFNFQIRWKPEWFFYIYVFGWCWHT